MRAFQPCSASYRLNRAAQFSGSGFENALRTEFRNLAQNPKRLRGFSAEEQAAIRRVARGGPADWREFVPLFCQARGRQAWNDRDRR